MESRPYNWLNLYSSLVPGDGGKVFVILKGFGEPLGNIVQGLETTHIATELEAPLVPTENMYRPERPCLPGTTTCTTRGGRRRER